MQIAKNSVRSSAAITSCSVFPITRLMSGRIGRWVRIVEPKLSVTTSCTQ